MAYSARLLSTNALQKQINQAHTFVVGDVVRLSAGIYVKAQADSEAHAAVCGMVSYVPDANTFFLCQVGYVSSISVAKAPNTLYYLDESTAGALTAGKPTVVGQVVVPCFIAFAANEGYFFGNTGVLIKASGVLPWVPVAINTTMAANTGYMCSSGATLDMTLPAVSAVGDKIQIIGITGLFKIVQAGAQVVKNDGTATTPGAGGSATSTVAGDGISLICTVANTSWQTDVGPVGVFNLV